MSAVLLVNPRMTATDNARLPLSLLHLAAVLEGIRPWEILDGNVLDDVVAQALASLARRPHAAVGITVMPGPQVAPAIELSRAIRRAHPTLPIVWGGYFPTLYPDAALAAAYVDVVVRGQGEDTFVALLDALERGGSLDEVAGISWKRDGAVVHNVDRALRDPDTLPPLPYGRLPTLARTMPRTFLGRRTAMHQLAIGCRYRCEFCGVVSMWNGATRLDAPARVVRAGVELRDRYGADSLQLVDHNFFDREESSRETLDALAHVRLPWWCYARTDTLAGFSTATWQAIERSRLRMVYVGAESGSAEALKQMQKGAKIEHTIETVERCKAHGVIPELSFVLGGSDDPDGEIDATFQFIRRLKKLHAGAEIILYFYSPTPQRRGPGSSRALPVLQRYGPRGGQAAHPLLPRTPEEWTSPEWVRWVCHDDAPWLTELQRRRIRDFVDVLGCRFPTVQDARLSRPARRVLSSLAWLRYATERYERPYELRLAKRLVRLREPQRDSL